MDYETVSRLVTAFDQAFGGVQGLRSSRAPGRVNLIGEHTDYNGGFVMPMAVDREVRFLFRPVEAGPVRVWCENYGEWDEFDLDDVRPNKRQPWSNYVRGTARALLEAGCRLRPVEGIIFGDLPIGGGLASSAALEVSVALALCEAASCSVPPRELSLLCQRAENSFVGVNCGIMDQFTCLHAVRGHALFLDCRSLEYRTVPMDGSAACVVVCNTMVHHELGSSAYNQRRAACERAARLLNARLGGIEQLRDVTSEMLLRHADLLDAETLKRTRHVVTENERARRGAEALSSGDYGLFGRLMDESHESLRSDYEVSCAELDLMVGLARKQPGVLGARMVGAGFGGCTVNLVRPARARPVVEALRSGYEAETGIEPEVYAFTAAAGASVERR